MSKPNPKSNAGPPPATSCLQIFFSDMESHGVWPVLCERRPGNLRELDKRQAVAQVRAVTRSLEALGVGLQSGVTFHAAASFDLWIAEWGVLANRSVAVIVPQEFSPGELAETLAENKSRIAFVDTIAAAQSVAQLPGLPELTHIVCLAGAQGGQRPILSWDQFIEAGKDMPDRLSGLITAIAAEDRAILFHYKNEAGERRAMNYTHAQLLDHARKMDEYLAHGTVVEQTAVAVKFKHRGAWRKTTSYSHTVKADKAYIRTIDGVLAAVNRGRVIGHVMAYYIPPLKGATVQIAGEDALESLASYGSQVIIAEGACLDAVREQVAGRVRASGAVKWRLFHDMLQLGRQKFESTNGLSLLRRIQERALRRIIGGHVARLLGGKLRLAISVGDAAHYETQLFFHSFGINFIELPLALFAAKEGSDNIR